MIVETLYTRDRCIHISSAVTDQRAGLQTCPEVGYEDCHDMPCISLSPRPAVHLPAGRASYRCCRTLAHCRFADQYSRRLNVLVYLSCVGQHPNSLQADSCPAIDRSTSCSPKNGPIYSPHHSTTSPHRSPAGNLPWPTNDRLARETEISSLSEILLRSQCGRDDLDLALARRLTTLDILDE
jgi:hypothetical protein